MTRDANSRTFTNQLIAASAALACSCSDSTEPTSPVAARLVVLSGDGQHAVAGQPLPEPVSVQVLDSSDHPMPDQRLTFEVLSGGGSLSRDSAATNSAGTVSTSWTLGPQAGASQALIVKLIEGSRGGHLIYVTLTAVAESPTQTPPTERVLVVVQAGASQSCGLTADGAAYCWGSWALGSGLAGVAPQPTAVAGGLRFARLALGDLHTCGLTLAGAAYCWGSGTLGQLGNGGTSDALGPRAVSGDVAFQDIAAGYDQSCGLTAAGQAYCWGGNSLGQLGDGTTTDRRVPTAVAGGLTFRAIAPGFTFTCALTVSGSAYCWGARRFTSTIDPLTTPTPVDGDLVFTAITAGSDHACGIVASGHAYCWGSNAAGQFGNGSLTASEIPVLAGGGRAFTAISAGWYHTCGLTTDGEALCWGWDDMFTDSRTFTGNVSIHSVVPVPLPGALRFASLDEGADHGCGITTDQVAYCWFSNDSGALGDGTHTGSYQPVAVR
jgi:alpha-tubulin suppressor-like RCC1 family protein